MDPADDAVESHYDAIAADWADIIDSPGRTHVLWPAVRDLLPDVATPIREFARVLGDDGVLALSIHHPLRDYLVVRDRDHPDTTDLDLDPVVRADTGTPDYHATERFEVHWGGDEHPGVYYRRPLADLIDPLLEAGFTLEALEEPGPDADFERGFPHVAETLAEWPPGAICLRATR